MKTKLDGSTLKVYALHKHQYKLGTSLNCTLDVKLLVHNGLVGIKDVNLGLLFLSFWFLNLRFFFDLELVQ